MNSITRDDIDELLISSGITFYNLDKFIQKHSVYEQYKKNYGDKHKSIIENKWEISNEIYRSNNSASELTAEDYLAIIEFDLAISPYTGVPFEGRVEFYKWCLSRLKTLCR